MTRVVTGLEILGRIGGGHFGDVHLGRDPIHGEVAVKVMRRGPAETDRDWQARMNGLLAEGTSLKAAEHTNVVRVFGISASERMDAIHLVMEMCNGGSLAGSYLASPMTLREVRDHSTQMAQGLLSLHNRNMLHRDIKPANVLVDGTTTKLGDFGLVTDNLMHGYASQQGYLDHVAPEVFAGTGTNRKSDVWAFGMTLYRLLHGHLWYQQLSTPSKSQVTTRGMRNRLRWLPNVPGSWRRFVRKCLHDDRDHRYDSSDLCDALAALTITPEWKCVVGTSQVSWSLQRNNRLVQVDWNRLSPRRHHWNATSHPIGNGRSRRLDGRSTPASESIVQSELKAFFESQPG